MRESNAAASDCAGGLSPAVELGVTLDRNRAKRLLFVCSEAKKKIVKVPSALFHLPVKLDYTALVRPARELPRQDSHKEARCDVVGELVATTASALCSR